MIPNLTNLSSWNQTELENLISARVAESEALDFKKDLGPRPVEDFCKDISAMANTVGGAIVFGMDQDESAIASSLVGFDRSPDEVIRQLNQGAENGIDPRVPIRFQHVQMSNEKHALIAAVGRSRSGPHMNTHDNKVYKRLTRNNQPMNIQELRRALLESKSQETLAIDEHRRFIESERRRNAVGPKQPDYFVSFIPAPFTEEVLDMSDAEVRHQLDTMDKMPSGMGRLTFHGRRYTQEGNSKDSSCEILRTGIVHQHFRTHRNGEAVAESWVRAAIPRCTNAIRKLWTSYNISPAAHICFSIVDVKGCTMADGDLGLDYKPIHEHELEFPTIFISDSQTDLTAPFEDWFLRLRQAMGVT